MIYLYLLISHKTEIQFYDIVSVLQTTFFTSRTICTICSFVYVMV